MPRDGRPRAAASENDSLARDSIKPFLRWAGSKRKLLARLKPYWNPEKHRRYIEPFAGSACLFFELQPPQAILGDTNRELIELYRAVKVAPQAIFARFARIRRNSQTYYRWRALDPICTDSKTRAVRFLYLNRNCFNGIYRTNNAGAFNVPFGGKEGNPLGPLERDDFLKAAAQLRRARLVSGDFSHTLKLARKDDFVYLDPPFAVSSRRLFAQYGEKVFDRGDVVRLRHELRRLNRIGAWFLVSYADCTEARELASEWNSTKLFVRRNVAGVHGDRRLASEWLVSNIEDS